MAAGATYTPIATTTLGSATTSYTFTSVPQTYTDLILVFNGQIQVNTFFRFNGDSGTNYSQNSMWGDGTTAASHRESNISQTYIGDYIGNPLNNAGSMLIMQIQNYSNTTTYKTTLYRASNVSKLSEAGVSLWRNTAAITSVTVSSDSTNGMLAGSTLTLYGIASA